MNAGALSCHGRTGPPLVVKGLRSRRQRPTACRAASCAGPPELRRLPGRRVDRNGTRMLDFAIDHRQRWGHWTRLFPGRQSVRSKTFKQRGYPTSRATASFRTGSVVRQEQPVSISQQRRPVAPVDDQPVDSEDSAPCHCPHCGTDEYLVPESVQQLHSAHASGRTCWDVSYWCSNCDRYFGHFSLRIPAAWRNEGG